VSVTDEFATVVPPPNPVAGHHHHPNLTPDPEGTRLQQALDFVRHPNNHKQAFRFVCVGGSGYVVTTVTFALLVHAAGINDTVSFVLSSLAGMANNFWWNRSWTFDATHHHIGKQGVRFLTVACLVALTAYGVYELLLSLTGMEKVLAEGIAYILVTPFSFIAQKLWSFKS
jgi:putative flippase GtrA